MAIRPAVKDGQAGEYNGLKDSNLGHFFSRPHVFNHLRKMGLVTPRGKIVTEREWKNQNRVVSKRVSSLDGFTNHPYGNAMSSLPESWRSPNSSVASSGNMWNSKHNSEGRRAKPRRHERLSNIDSEEDSGSYRTSGGDSTRTRSSADTGDYDSDDGSHEDDSDQSSDYETNEADDRNTRASSRPESVSSSLRGKQKRNAPPSQTRTSLSSLSSYRGSETNLMFSEHNQRRKVERSSSSLSRPASSSNLSLASLEGVRDRLTGVGRRQGLRLLGRLRRHSDVLPVALLGEPYLHSLPPDTPVFRPPVTDAQIRSRLYRSPTASARTPRPVTDDTEQLLTRTDVTLTLQHTGRAAHVRLVQHTTPHTALTVYTGHLDTNEEFEVPLSPFSAGSLGLVLLVDDIVCMRLNGCCEHRYSLGAMLDGPSGRLRLLDVTALGQPCVRCQARRKRKKFMIRWSVGRIFSSIRKEESADSALNRNKSMSCSAVFRGGESTKPSPPSKFNKRYSNRIGIVNNQTKSLNQTSNAKENKSNRSTHPTGGRDRSSRLSSPNTFETVTSPETSARSGPGTISVSDASFYDKEYQRASVDKESDSCEEDSSGSKTSIPLSEDLAGSNEDTNVEEEIEESEVEEVGEEEVEEEVDEEEEEVLEEDYSSSDEQEKKKSSSSNSGSIRILGS